MISEMFLKRFRKDSTTNVTLAAENVSKNMSFCVFFDHFHSDLFPKGSNVIYVVCTGYLQVPLTVESIFKEVSCRFSKILGH